MSTPHTQSPPVIQQLSDTIANQIAAGEVIERPAAVVKELVENAIDAGSRRIDVRVEDGGRRLIEVVDNGHGMRREDLPLALCRHATSKLRNADDLFRIASLGFRGEALPSIAAVSEFSIASRAQTATEGAEIRINGGKQEHFGTAAMAPGTRVQVANLFWNVPARLKFLRSEASETGAISDMVMRLALGHPEVGFGLVAGERVVLDLPPGQTLMARMRDTLGSAIADGMLPVEGLADATQIQGFAAHPRHAKPSSKKQFVFLNGRAIHDKVLIAAIREGYKGFLEPRLHGVVVLHLDTDPSLVDVNVHPTKAEIRFRRQSEVFGLVRKAINSCLAENAGGFGLTGASADVVQRSIVKAATPMAPAEPQIQERFLPQGPATIERAQQPLPDMIAPSTSASETQVGSSQVHEAVAAYDTSGAPTAPDLPGVRKVVQLGDMYVLIETDQGIRLVDQHALHEKALFLCLEGHVTDLSIGGRQELLMPKPINLSASDIAIIEPQLANFAEVGIEAEVFGPTQILLRAHPAVLSKLNWERFFQEAAKEEPGPDAVHKLRERLAHNHACRSAIKAGKILSEAEMLELARLLYDFEHMEHCPHGRPTTLDLSWDELERRFQR